MTEIQIFTCFLVPNRPKVSSLRLVFASLLLLSNSFTVKTKAQSSNGFSIEPSLHFGHIFKHSPKLTIPIAPLSIGNEIHFNWQTLGQKAWHEWQGYPSVGVGFLHYDLGKKEVLGDAFAVYPSLDLRIFKRATWFRSSVQLGWGVAYLTKHYDQFTLPINNAIGSAINNITSLKLRFKKPLTAHWVVESNFSFTHFSNGSSRLPNYGINIPALNLGLIWQVQNIDNQSFIRRDSSKRSSKKWGVNAFGGLGLSASSVSRGPQYPIYAAALSIVRPLNKVNNLSVGIQYEQNRVVAEFGLGNGEYTSKAQAFKAGSRWGIFAGEEFMFGHVALILQSGYYLQQYESLESRWFSRLGVRLYSPHFGKVQGHIGIYLKAHKIIAEQFCVLTGVYF
ncbi:MAG: acyloxyacyl hydrolase [Saprospiraceae bacterium]|nr:acyloxyacyl hydrolase [Saprospiraceae bacterium]